MNAMLVSERDVNEARLAGHQRARRRRPRPRVCRCGARYRQPDGKPRTRQIDHWRLMEQSRTHRTSGHSHGGHRG